MFSDILTYLTISQCQVWVPFLLAIVLIILFAILYIKAKNRWLALSEQEYQKSRAELRNIQNKADQELRELRSKTTAEINASRTNAEKAIEEIQQRATSEINHIQAECENAITQERQLSVEKLRRERERILSEKSELMALPEKELLVHTVQALAGYANRLERIETVVFQLTDTAQQQQNSTNILQANVVTVCGAIENLSPQLEDIVTKLQLVGSFNDSLQEELGKLNTLLSDIKNWTEEMQDIDLSDPLHDIAECLETIKEKIEQVQGYSSTTSLTEITEIVESIKSTVSDLQGYSSFTSLTSIEQSLDEIRSSLDSRSY